jgi:hypothetical protein
MEGNPDKILALIHPEDIVLVMQKKNKCDQIAINSLK